ncbi:MAG: zinc-dependent metalloprotease family protein [Candidatus Heimdallarchaeaceae archaeon]
MREKNIMKRKISKSISALEIIGIIIVASAATILIVTNIQLVKVEEIFIEKEYIKGENVTLKVQMNKKIEEISEIDYCLVGIKSENYSYEGVFKANIEKIEIDNLKTKRTNITVSLKPLIKNENGYYALNVGNYEIESLELKIGRKIIKHRLNANFVIKHGEEEERIKNGNFEQEGDYWIIEYNKEKFTLNFKENEYTDGKALILRKNEEKTETNQTSILTMTQKIKLKDIHYLEMDVKVISENESKVKLSVKINNKERKHVQEIDEKSKMHQKIIFGEIKEENEEANISIEITTTEEINKDFEIIIDNVSIRAYEKKIFIAILDNNWKTAQGEVIRNETEIAVERASKYFEKNLGIKLMPLVRVEWKLESENKIISLDEMHEKAIKDAEKLLGLKQEWIVEKGRSEKNNGFDMLNAFTNRTGEHFGFIFGGENAAFHFAQSNYLQKALNEAGMGYIQVTIIDEWAESLVQHEVSHIFGAKDRDSREYEPSVMTKQLTTEEIIKAFIEGKMWLQCNNWLIEDMKIMIENVELFK